MTGKISWVIHLFLFYHRENRNEKIPPYGGEGFFRIEEIRMNLPGMEGGPVYRYRFIRLSLNQNSGFTVY